MPRAPCTFKETDVRRAIRATKAAGVSVARVEIDRDGKIVIVTAVEPPTDLIDDLDVELAEVKTRQANARNSKS